MKTDTNQVEEVWKNVPSMPPNIEVSNLGQVRMYESMTQIKILPVKTSNGYRAVTIHGRAFTVARLVAEAFVSFPKDAEVVTHINGDKMDDRAENLAWVSHGQVGKTRNRAFDNRDKIYCPETDTVYGSMRTASYFTELPQELIATAIKAEKRICGYTFKMINSDDPILLTHNIMYITYEDMLEIVYKAKSREEAQSMLLKHCGDGIRMVY